MNRYSLYDQRSGKYHYFVGGQPNVMIPEDRGTFLPVQNILVSLPDGGYPNGVGDKAEGILLSPGGIRPSVPSSTNTDWNDHLFVRAAIFLGGILFWRGIRG